MLIEIDTRDSQLASHLMETATLSPPVGQEISLPGDVRLVFEGEILQRGPGFPETIQLTASFPVGAASTSFAAWLYEKIKGRSDNLRIGRTEVQIDKREIAGAIKEKVHKAA